MCVCMCLCVFTCVNVQHLCVCVCVRLCISVCMRECVRACACVCLRCSEMGEFRIQAGWLQRIVGQSVVQCNSLFLKKVQSQRCNTSLKTHIITHLSHHHSSVTSSLILLLLWQQHTHYGGRIRGNGRGLCLQVALRELDVQYLTLPLEGSSARRMVSCEAATVCRHSGIDFVEWIFPWGIVTLTLTK